MRRLKLIRLSLLLIIMLMLALGGIQSNCPKQGMAVSPRQRQFVTLKNRVDLPQQHEFEESVILAAMLQPGDDRSRWSESRAAAIEGYVLEVRKGGIEAANCFSITNRDIHIHIGARQDAPPRERVVVEVTPRMREWAERQNMDWSESVLERELIGRWCRFEGWLLFDIEHADESENTVPGREENWRATAWEIHPVTAIKVIKMSVEPERRAAPFMRAYCEAFRWPALSASPLPLSTVSVDKLWASW